MPTSSRRIAGAVLALVIILVIGAEWEEWRQLLPTVSRTVAVSAAAGAAAAIMGAAMAFAHRLGGQYSWAIAMIACIPLVFPSVALATALIQAPFGMNPYSPAIVIVSQAIGYLPVTFVIQALALASVSDEVLMVSASLGASPLRTIQRVLRRPWLRGFGMSGAVATLFIASDPSVTLVYGGTDSYVASHMFRGVSTGLTTSIGPALVALVLPAVVFALFLTSIDWGALREPFRVRAPEFVSEYMTARRALLPLTAPIAVTVLLLLAVIVRGASRVSLANGLPVTLAATTLVVLLLVIPAALLGALATTYLARRGPALRIIVTGLLAGTFLLSQSVIGMMLSAVFRDSITIGSATVLPSLVGGGSLAGGYVAVGLAYLSVALPIAHVGMMIMVRDMGDLVDAARDAGADRVRAGFVLAPVLAPRMIALFAFMSGVILTRTTPIIFVQPPGFETASTSLTTLAAAGWDDRVFAVSLVTALVATVSFLVATAGLSQAWWGTGSDVRRTV